MLKVWIMPVAVAFYAASGLAGSSANATPISITANSISPDAPFDLVQACPRGFNYSYRSGRCLPADRGYRRGYYGGGGYNACPPGTNPYGGRCVWGGGVACPPGYNALGGRCVQNW